MRKEVNLEGDLGFHPSLSFLVDGVRTPRPVSHRHPLRLFCVWGYRALLVLPVSGNPQATKALWLQVLRVTLQPLTDAGGVQGQKLSNFFTPFGDTQVSPTWCP